MPVELGQTATIWLARGAVALYLVALGLLFARKTMASRMFWTAGLAVYLIHVGFAFTYFYGWSHSVAFRETARQTADLFGVNWGGGIYLNYLFTAIWIADCAWWWTDFHGYARRPAAIRSAIHGFLAFMFVNASVVVWAVRAWR